MARDYARIMTAIWRNREFRGLTEQQQRGYLFLVTQPDISAAGVLPLRVRRWADASSSSTVDGLSQILKELEAGRFICVDWDAEELLIRSFIRWDGGFNNPKRRPVIIRAAEEVESAAISRHIETEFKRCGITTTPPPDGPSGGSEVPTNTDAGSDPGSLSEINRVDLNDEPFPQVNSLSDTASTNRGRVPQPTTHNPQPTTQSSLRSDPPPRGGAQLAVLPGGQLQRQIPPSAQGAVAVWHDAFIAHHDSVPTQRQIKQVGREARALIDAGNLPDGVVAAARSAGARGLATVEREHRDLAKRRDVAQPTAHAPAPRPSTTDARVNAGLALAAKYAHQEAAG